MTTKDPASTLGYERNEDPAEMTRVEGVEGGRERDLLCPTETVMCDWVGVAGGCVLEGQESRLLPRLREM